MYESCLERKRTTHFSMICDQQRMEQNLTMTSMSFVKSVVNNKEKDPAEACLSPASILRKSTSGHHWPVSYPDGPMTAQYRFT